MKRFTNINRAIDRLVMNFSYERGKFRKHCYLKKSMYINYIKLIRRNLFDRTLLLFLIYLCCIIQCVDNYLLLIKKNLRDYPINILKISKSKLLIKYTLLKNTTI